MFDDTESVVLAKIQPTLTALGFESAQADWMSANRIEITNPATEATHTINTDEGAAAAESLNAWISGQLTTESAERFIKLNQGSSAATGELD